MANVALSGYGTVDYVSNAMSEIVPKGTNSVEVVQGAFPRAGGAPLFAGRALASAGHAVAPVLSIGADDNGALLRSHIRIGGLSPRGVVLVKDARTATCFLIHQPDGGYCCFIDRGSLAPQRLNAMQRAIVKAADWVMVSAGPSLVTEEVLAALSPEQKLAWIVKADEVCFPRDLRARLQARASLIFLNRLERDFLDLEFTADQAIFETHGARGVRVSGQGAEFFMEAEPVDVNDATGAGDTFAGAATACLIDTPGAFEQAAWRGVIAVQSLLRGRLRTLQSV